MQLIVERESTSRVTRIYIRQTQGDTEILIGQKNGHLVEQRVESFSPLASQFEIVPLLTMPMHMVDKFLAAVVDYASDQNIKTVNENHMQGRLTATENHLQDLRTYFGKALDKLVG